MQIGAIDQAVHGCMADRCTRNKFELVHRRRNDVPDTCRHFDEAQLNLIEPYRVSDVVFHFLAHISGVYRRISMRIEAFLTGNAR